MEGKPWKNEVCSFINFEAIIEKLPGNAKKHHIFSDKRVYNFKITGCILSKFGAQLET